MDDLGYDEQRQGMVFFMVGTELKIHKLPSVPEVLLRLVEVCRRPQVSLDDVVSIIRHDAVLTARIIALASASSRLEKIDNEGFKSLVSTLGVEVVGSAASSTAANQYFSRSWSGGGRYIGLWRQSLECACLARSLASATEYPEPEEAYLAGLLHNLGRWAYQFQFPEEYASVVKSDHSEQEVLAAEKELFGMTGVEAAASLMRDWAGDALISDAVLFQDMSVDAVLDSPDLIRLLNLARRLMGSEPWEDKSVFQDAEQLLSLNTGQLLDIRKEAIADQQKIVESYGFRSNREGLVVGGTNIRRALTQHVHDSALVGGVNLYASEDAWQAAVRHFEILFGVTEVAAFEYVKTENRLRASRFGSGVEAARFGRIDVPVRPGRNLLAEACLGKRVMSTIDAQIPSFGSVLHAQLQRIFGRQELLVMPVGSGGEALGVLVAGFNRNDLEELLRSREILDYFLDTVAQQLGMQLTHLDEKSSTAESEIQELITRTRSLVHEANNPLGVVANYLQILSMKFEQDNETHKQINIIKEEIDRVADILSTIRGVPETVGDQRVAVDINTLLEEIVSIFKVSLFEPNGISCELELDRKIPEVHAIPSHIKQVITNLLKNSVEALGSKGKGTITVETNDAVYFDGRQCIRIVVADNGPGIAPNILDHLFASAISSKGAPHSGVGLMLVKSLVSEMGGNVLVYSKQGEGARFELFLPRE